MEASKFTEVGYVGRDVDSIIRDLVESAVSMVRKESFRNVQDRAEALAEERLVDILCPMPRKRRTVPNPFEVLFNPAQQEQEYDEDDDFNERVRQARVQRKLIRQQLRDGELEDQEVEIEVEDTTAPRVEFFDGVGMQEMEINMQDIFRASIKDQEENVCRGSQRTGYRKKRPCDQTIAAEG